MAKKVTESTKTQVSVQEIEETQKEWADAIIEIGALYIDGVNVDKIVACAKEHIKNLYNYDDEGGVLFKPTKAAKRPFRPTLESALSYFVGNALAPAGFNEDDGFATTPFIGVEFENTGFILRDDSAITMGSYYFKTTAGDTVKAEYTFGYRRKGGKLVIELHHSSLPYDPA